LGSFYCYLNYDSKKDFVIDLDFLWKWLDFSTKRKAKELLFKHFIENIDYIISDLSENDQDTALTLPAGKVKKDGRGGLRHKQKIMMNIRTFKSLSLKANTKKSADIQNYFIDLEEAIFEITSNQSRLLYEQNSLLQETTTTLQEKLTHAESRVQQRHKKTYASGKAIYVLRVKSNETHFKLGHTNNLENRLSQYRTGNPDQDEYYFHCFWYSPLSYEIEQLLLKAFQPDKINMNSEWISLTKLSDLEKAIDIILQIFSPNIPEKQFHQTVEKQTVVISKPEKKLPECERCGTTFKKTNWSQKICFDCTDIKCTICKEHFPRKDLSNHQKFCSEILQLHPETFKIIAEYSDLGTASMTSNIPDRYIRDTCNGFKKMAGNYIWVWKNKKNDYLESLRVSHNGVIYTNLQEAQIDINLCLNSETQMIFFMKPIQSNSAIKHCKKIRQINNETSEEHIWDSTVAASTATGIDKSSIIRCCKGKQKTAGNYNWIYV
jgi:phage anti-repressor protein